MCGDRGSGRINALGVTSSSSPAAAAVTPPQDLRWLTLSDELLGCRKEIRGVLLGIDEFSHLSDFPEVHLLVNNARGSLQAALLHVEQAISRTLRTRPAA